MMKEEEEAHEEKATPLIRLKNIHKTYLLGIEGVPALRGVSMTVNKGEWLVIYGTSGGGKTTLLNIIGTIDKPTKGEIQFGNVRVNPETPDDVLASIRLNNLGFVFQTFNLLTAMTAQENVELPMVLKGEKTAAERKAIAESSLEKMGLKERTDHYPNMLSGGEQQRVTIARALANRPDLLLLDEPTGDLDTKNSKMVIKMMDKLNVDEDVTLIMVTHDMYLKNFASRVIWMRDGKIAKEEVVSPKKRAEAMRKLYEDDPLMAGPKEKAPESAWANTEVREPESYQVVSGFEESEKKKKHKTKKGKSKAQ
eukprot:Lithocolla_globosa_v1_NODE_4355_length_1455_cov_15.122857.p1 type:complete len:310 gc:universal NODE_4355_length_1455_cov_15.122857:1164-235(-)